MFAPLHRQTVLEPLGSCLIQYLRVAPFFESVAANEDGYWRGGKLGGTRL
jgi:hypothetical protein